MNTVERALVAGRVVVRIGCRDCSWVGISSVLGDHDTIREGMKAHSKETGHVLHPEERYEV